MLVSVCVCLCACLAALFAYGNYLNTERPRVGRVIDTLMEAMAAEDPAAAYALFSPRARNTVILEDLEAMLTGNNYVLFENYRATTIEQFAVTLDANSSPDMPQGTVAVVRGRVIYSDNYTDQYEATLENSDGEWLLVGINVNVPPDKFDP